MKWSWKRFGIVAAISFVASTGFIMVGMMVGLAVVLFLVHGWHSLIAGLAEPQFLRYLSGFAGSIVLGLILPLAVHALTFTVGLMRWKWGEQVWSCLAWSVGAGLGILMPCLFVFHHNKFDYEGWIYPACVVTGSAGTGMVIHRYLLHIRRAEAIHRQQTTS